MNRQEFSDNFDVLIHSYANRAEFGNQVSFRDLAFNEHEKSVFLTKAQNELVIALYNGQNHLRESFEETEELRRYLAPLVVDADLPLTTNTSGVPLGLNTNSQFFTLPPDVWFIVYESVELEEPSCESMSVMDVIPVTHDEYHKIKRNPFRGVNGRRALRLDLADGVIEIVSKKAVKSYHVRYLRKPCPIILVNLPSDLYIEEKQTAMGCELPESLHQKILEAAVMMALQSAGYKSASKEDNK